ncbi:zinc finger protein 62 [Caerostris extrusa]|uniref:Zinc finger protein 62 n=1 Tax=Caerostris extrusa TaxID=172846 RepID=A0AAV4V2Z9_CAEEX|nr:zinc finger protein 62 [Caerostris extrusa]
MNVLSDILCDTSSIMAPQNFKETLSQNKAASSQNIAPKQDSLHLLGSVSQIPAMDRSLTSVNHTNIDIYNTSNQIHAPSNMHPRFDDRTDVSVFSDSFPEIVPSWLTHDFMKVSETLSSPNILSNVPDIYPARENEHLEMLDLGFSPELTSHDVTSNGFNQTEGQKLLMELPMQRFSNNDPLLISSYNGINVNERNAMQYEKFKPNQHMSNSQLLNSVLPCESELLHLPLHSNVTNQCLTTTSSPSMMSNSQSQSHPVEAVCDKLPHINLNNLDSFLGSESTLSEIQLLPQNFQGVSMSAEVNCNQSNQPCSSNCGSDPRNTRAFLNPSSTAVSSTQDISVQVSESALNENLFANHCFSCSQVNSNAAIDVIQCFKCKFCDYINIHKCAIENHINAIHSKPQHMSPAMRNDMSSNQMSAISSSSIPATETNQMCLSKSNISVTTATVMMPSDSQINDTIVSLPNGVQNTKHFHCIKCNRLFSDAAAYKSHSLSCHGFNPESLQNNIVPCSKPYLCVKCNKLFSDALTYESHLVTEHNIDPKSVLINNQSIPEGYNLYYNSGYFYIIKALDINGNEPQIQKTTDNHDSNSFQDLSNTKSNCKQKLQSKNELISPKSVPYVCNLETTNKNTKLTKNQELPASQISDLPQKELSNLKLNRKPKLLPKRMDDWIKNFPLKKTNSETSNGNSEKQLSSRKIAWKKKVQRELGSYICEFKGCNVRFRALDNLEYHKKCHVADGNTFACLECGSTFDNWATIAGHLWRNHKNDMELHACDQCPFRTYSLSRLENIHKRIHREECLFLCDTCGKKFKNGKQMRNHRAIHLNKPKKKRFKPEFSEPVFKCKACPGLFQSKVLLRHHLDAVHNIKPKTYACNYCDYTSLKSSTFDMHMRKHTGEKPFKCDECDYCTSDHNSLRRHKMKHSGEKKYKCPYCPYSSIQANTYKSHLKKHPGHNQLMFSCKICPFQTLKRETFFLHMKDHESLSLLSKVNFLNEINSTEDSFPLAEAMDISLSHDNFYPTSK